MNQQNKWVIIFLTFCSFSQISFADTTKFQKELDDFAWSLGERYEQGLSPTLFDDIHTFTNEHHQDYQKARTESLKKWQVAKINTTGFREMHSEALDEHTQALFQTSASNANDSFSVFQHWKILNVQTMTNMLANHTLSFLHQPPFDFSISRISLLSSTNYLFGMRYATIPLENNEWEIWAYGHGLAYRYKWDLRQNQIKDFSIWIKEEYVK